MVTSRTQIPGPPLVSSRREFLKVSCASAFAIGTTTGIVSCSSAISSAIGHAVATLESLFDHDWLQHLAIAIAATEITHILEHGLEGSAWAAWDAGVESILEDILAFGLLAMDSGFVAGGRGEEPRFSQISAGPQARFIPGDVGWADQVPPVVMAQVSQVPHGDPRTDLLVACVDTGKTRVIFAPWAWQALSLYVQDLTKNRTGADLEAATALCRRRLIPSGTGPKAGEDTLLYEALDGTVEIALISRSSSGSTVTITAPPAEGINGSFLQKQFELPAA